MIIMSFEIEELKEKLNSNISTNDKQNMKYIDILFHLKENIKNNIYKICSCNSKNKYYCIPCKLTCCSLCSLEKHESHNIININEFLLDEKNINKIFNNFSNNIKKSELIKNSNDIRQKLNKYIDITIDEFINKLNIFRKKQKNDIDNIFNNFDINKNTMMENINNIHVKLNEYINKTKLFYNLNNDSNDDNSKYTNIDNYNTYFLHGYDLINLTKQNIIKIYKYIETLEDDLRNYITNQAENFSQIKTELDKLLYISNEKEKNIILDNNDIFSLAKPISNFIFISDNLSKDNFINIKERLSKYLKHIKNFRKMIYKIINKTGNLKEVEKNIKSLDLKKLKGVENLFSLRDQDKIDINNSSYFSLNKKTINSEDDICLNNPLINKYYSLLFIDLFEKYFKPNIKDNQTSYVDLQIWKKDVNADEEDETDIAKIIEGTNEIHIYEKKNKKMVKFSLKLTKNPYGYTKFPIGCRNLLIGDKLYITGGRDEYNEYPNVLIFDRKTQNLKRIIDLRIPRAYHTMIYSEIFNTILVIGGEHEPSVEIFDPVTYRWQLLPDLNIPRANSLFYCDSPRGILYTMFGNEGSILDNKYSDIIEFLDLKNIEDGWNILDYKNKSEIDLKSLMSIYPLNSDLILLYGGVVFRGNNKSVCIFNLEKSEITKIDQKIMDTLRIEAKKSKKLNIIISGLSSKNSSKLASNNSSKMNF